VTDSTAETEDLTEIPGVGKVAAVRLEHAGYETRADLRFADFEELVEIEDVSGEVAGRIKDEVGDADPPDSWNCPEGGAGSSAASPADQRHCGSCGATLDPGEGVCAECGWTVAGIKTQNNAGVAALLSLVITGMGQVYVGRGGRGAVFFGTAALVGVIAVAQREPAMFFFAPIIQAVSVIDAANLAQNT